MGVRTGRPGGVRRRWLRVAAAGGLVASAVTATLLGGAPGVAGAGPLPDASPQAESTNATGTVPNGACFATINARSQPGNGGTSGTLGELGPNGAGVDITAAFPVSPGDSYSVVTANGGVGTRDGGDGHNGK